MRPEKAQPQPDDDSTESETADTKTAEAASTETVAKENLPPQQTSGETLAAVSPAREEPAPPQDAPAREPAPPPPSLSRARRIRMALVLLVALVALLSYGAYWLMWLRGTVSTDDAYVDARIVSASSRLPGRVVGVPVSEGDTVEKGQVLVQLSQAQMGIRRDQIRAEVAKRLARANELRNGARPEEIEVARAETRRHQVELGRRTEILTKMEGLAPIKNIAVQELDQLRAEAELARVDLEVSRRKLDLMLAGSRVEAISQAEAELALALAQLADVEADLTDLTIRSPIDGVVARRMVDPGEFVEDGQGMMQIVETGRTWVVANLEEGDFEAVRQGQRVDVDVDAYPGLTVRGKVSSVYSATLSRFSLLSTTSTSGSFIKVTQRVPVRIEWDQEDFPPMYPGLNVIVRIYVSD